MRQLAADAAASRASTTSGGRLVQDVSFARGSTPAPQTNSSASDLHADLQNLTLSDTNARRQQVYAEQQLAMLISHHRRQAMQEARDEQFAKDLDLEINSISDNTGGGPSRSNKNRSAKRSRGRAKPYTKNMRRRAAAPIVPSGRRYTGKS